MIDTKPIGTHTGYFLSDRFSNVGLAEVYWTVQSPFCGRCRGSALRVPTSFMEEVCPFSDPVTKAFACFLSTSSHRFASAHLGHSHGLDRSQFGKKCLWEFHKFLMEFVTEVVHGNLHGNLHGRIWNQRNRWRKDTLSKKGCLEKGKFYQSCFEEEDKTAPTQYESLGIIQIR